MESSDAGGGGDDDDEEGGGAASSSRAALNAFEEIQPLDDLSLIRCCICLPACVGAVMSGPGAVIMVVVWCCGGEQFARTSLPSNFGFINSLQGGIRISHTSSAPPLLHKFTLGRDPNTYPFVSYPSSLKYCLCRKVCSCLITVCGEQLTDCAFECP